MHVIIALAVLAVSFSVGGCSRAYQEVYAKPIPPPSRHATKVKWVKRPPPSARNLPELTKTSSVKPPPVLTPAAKHYVVRNTVGNCAVIVLSAHLKLAPGNKWARPGDDLEIIDDKGGYASSESANKALKDAPCSNPPRG